MILLSDILKLILEDSDTQTSDTSSEPNNDNSTPQSKNPQHKIKTSNWSSDEHAAFLSNPEHSVEQVRDHAALETRTQRAWRNSLHSTDKKALRGMQNIWQGSPAAVGHSRESIKQSYNDFDAIMNHHRPHIKSNRPVERGMTFNNTDELDKYLSTLHADKPISMGSAGYSLNPLTARNFSFAPNKAGVLLRMHPYKGKIHGLLWNTDTSGSHDDDLSHEYELARSRSALAKLKAIHRINVSGNQYPYHIIDLQDLGY
jgi:hypothetical protein